MTDLKGVTDPLELESLNAEKLYSESIPVAGRLYTDANGDYVGIADGSEVARDSNDAGAVVNAIDSTLTDKGKIDVAAGGYQLQTAITIDTEGVLLSGDGISWGESALDGMGTYFYPDTATFTDDWLVRLNGQFSSIEQIGLDGQDSVTQCLSVAGEYDHQVHQCALHDANLYNAQVSVHNVWFTDCWIEFAGYAGIFVGAGGHGSMYVDNCHFVRNSNADIDFETNYSNFKVQNSTLASSGVGIATNANDIKNATIANNTFQAVGRNDSKFGADNTCIYMDGKIETVSIVGNAVDGQRIDLSQDSTVYTDHFVVLGSSATIPQKGGLEIANNPVRQINGDELVDNGVYGYKFEGVGYEEASAETPSSGWGPYDTVLFRDTGDQTGDDLYTKLPSSAAFTGTWYRHSDGSFV